MSGIPSMRAPGVRRLLEAVAEAWRERRSERRAIAAPRCRPDPRIPRSRIGAALEARLAVRSGVRIDDFLRQRLAKYAGALPVPLEALPISVDIEGGEAQIRPRRPARAPAFPARDADAARGGADREGDRGARELREAHAALERLGERVAAARERLDAIEQDLSRALASGELASWPDLDASPEQLGRPPVPSPAPIRALRGFVAGLVAAEAWRFSAPILSSSGFEPEVGIEAALRGSPVPATLALVFASGAAAAVFAFAAVALARGAEAIAAAGRGRAPLLGVTAAGAALLAAGIAAAATAPDRWAQLALLVALPFGGALLWRAAERLEARRAVALEAALAWDRERAREAVERGRREAVRDRAAAELRAAEAERAAARRRLQQLERLAIAAERAADLAARAEARRLDRLSEGLAAALELDRYLYIRLAAERSGAPIEREVRPVRLEAAIATERIGLAR